MCSGQVDRQGDEAHMCAVGKWTDKGMRQTHSLQHQITVHGIGCGLGCGWTGIGTTTLEAKHLIMPYTIESEMCA